MSFAVVYFMDDDLYSEVPKNWLFDQNNKCYWPPTRNVQSVITKKQKPEDNWNFFNVKVHSFYGKIYVYFVQT